MAESQHIFDVIAGFVKGDLLDPDIHRLALLIFDPPIYAVFARVVSRSSKWQLAIVPFCQPGQVV